MESRTSLSSTQELRERARRQVMDGPVTEAILAVEEEHADDLVDLLEQER